MSAIKNKLPGPQELAEFRLAEAFWTRFGVRFEELDDWPMEKVEVYVEIMNIEAQVQEAQQKEQSNNGGGGGQSAAQTEAAYQAMLAAQAQ